MIKEREANSWKSVSYAKSISGAQTYTKFPIVLRTTEQSIPTWNVKGNMVQSGTPTPTSPITPSECGTATLNVMPSASQQSIENNGITITCDGKGSYHIFGTSTNAVSIEFDIPTFTIPTCVNSGGLGTMSLFNGQIGSTQGASRIYFKNGTTAIDSWQLIQASRTSTNYTALDNKVCNKIEFTIATGITVDTYVRPMFTNDGQLPSNYEPYGYKLPIVSGNITTNIYLSEPLRKIGDYADTIAADGTVTRKIKKLVLTGEEVWGGSNGTFYLTSVTPDYMRGQNLNLAVCSHYNSTPQVTSIASVPDKSISFSYSTSVQRFYLVDTSYTDTTGLITYLQQQYSAGTPVTVWYILTSPTTETTTTSAIPTTSGLNTIDVATTLKPSEMSLTYDGYKLCKRQRYSRTAQLLDKDNIVDGGAFYPSITSNKMATSNNTAILLLPCKPNTTYTISRRNVITKRFVMCFLTSNEIYADMPIYGDVGDDTALTLTSTSTAESQYLCFYYAKTGGSGSSTPEEIQAQLAEVMINEGSTAKPYQPYLDWE